MAGKDAARMHRAVPCIEEGSLLGPQNVHANMYLRNRMFCGPRTVLTGRHRVIPRILRALSARCRPARLGYGWIFIVWGMGGFSF